MTEDKVKIVVDEIASCVQKLQELNKKYPNTIQIHMGSAKMGDAFLFNIDLLRLIKQVEDDNRTTSG